MENKERLGSSGIGGQAVIEGIMMRNKDKYAVAVRKPDKSIDVDIQECGGIAKKYKITTLPFIRGIFSFTDSMVIGIKTLTYSASFFEDEDEQEEAGYSQAFAEKEVSTDQEKGNDHARYAVVNQFLTSHLVDDDKRKNGGQSVN